jgi:hypothetical protein
MPIRVRAVFAAVIASQPPLVAGMIAFSEPSGTGVSSPRQRVMESITRFITQKLKLKVNEAKSAVARPKERKFLGFSLRLVRRSSASLRQRHWIGLSNESGRSRAGPRASA